MSKYTGTKTLEVLEGADKYNKWIASSIEDFIESPTLEIGAGTGNISSNFTSLKDLTLTDVDPELVRKLAERFKVNKNIQVELFDVSSKLNKVTNHFKTVYSVNVIEHIKDDKKALANMYSLLNKGGKVVLLVPAKRYAYNKLDKNLGHFRRYEKEELKNLLKKANFDVIHLEYFNVLGLLSWMIREKVSLHNNRLRPYQVKIFNALVPLLRRVEPKQGLPFGISLIAVGRKI